MKVLYVRNHHCGPNWNVVVDDEGREFRIDRNRLFTATGLSCSCGGSVVDGLPAKHECAHIVALREAEYPIEEKIDA